jgi:hypothetical protein
MTFPNSAAGQIRLHCTPPTFYEKTHNVKTESSQ